MIACSNRYDMNCCGVSPIGVIGTVIGGVFHRVTSSGIIVTSLTFSHWGMSQCQEGGRGFPGDESEVVFGNGAEIEW